MGYREEKQKGRRCEIQKGCNMPGTAPLAVLSFIVGAVFTVYVMRIWELGDVVMY